MPLSCRMTWPLPTRDLSSAFPPFLVLLWEHYGWWFSLGQKEGEKGKKKKKAVCTMVSNFRLEGSYIFKTILLTKLITEKMLNET